jgi:hypothetical protein
MCGNRIFQVEKMQKIAQKTTLLIQCFFFSVLFFSFFSNFRCCVIGYYPKRDLELNGEWFLTSKFLIKKKNCNQTTKLKKHSQNVAKFFLNIWRFLSEKREY